MFEYLKLALRHLFSKKDDTDWASQIEWATLEEEPQEPSHIMAEETLYYLTCGCCHNEWSVAGQDGQAGRRMTCPYCGIRLEIVPWDKCQEDSCTD
jgi:DNA-directed RNA polymerase subunit RPC12/RpoP